MCFIFQTTAAQRWNLVCEQKYMNQLIQVTYFLGNFVGTLLSGFISDHYGRKFCYLLCLTLWICLALISSQISNFYMWLCIRFLCGSVSSGYYVASSVYLVEITHGKWRSLFVNTLHEIGIKAGLVSVAILVYLLKDMVLLQVVIGFCNVPFLALWFFMPESPRWLLAQHEKDQAECAMTKICHWNKKPTDDIKKFLENEIVDKHRKGSYADLLKYPPIRRNILLICFSWFASSLGFLGLTYNTPALHWSIILIFALPPAISLLFAPLESLLQNALGRKFMLTVPLICSGILLGVMNFLGKGSPMIIVLAWMGTVLCDIAMGSAFIFTKELFPTNYRTQALSMASSCNKFGAIVSPFVAMLVVFNDMLPFAVYGAILMTAGILSLWIWPETSKLKIPDTLEEAKNLANSKNSWFSFTTLLK